MLGSALKQLAIGTARYLRYRAGGLSRQRVDTAHAGDSATPLRLDLGCGTAKREGFLGIDRRSFAGVDGVTDLTKSTWLFKTPTLGDVQLIPATVSGKRGFVLPDNSVGEVYCSHFLEHLEHNQSKPERVRFMNELWRVMIPGGRATIITPHWASNLAFGDFTHADKPVSEWFYLYLGKEWRASNAPDNDIRHNPDGYYCDFSSELGHRMHPGLAEKTADERQYALNWYKDAAVELHALLLARK